MSTTFRFYDPELFDHQLDHDWICSICSLVVRKPLDLACGHLFCSECLHQWRGDNKNNTCPICRHLLPPTVDCKINQFVTKKVWRMTVHCCNFKSGCSATVTLGEEGCNMTAHVAVCPYERIPCQDCKVRLFRSALPEHATKCELRIVQCGSCSGSFKQHDLMAHQKHPLGCAFLIQCPNACKIIDHKGNSILSIVKRSELSSHLAECPLEPIPCELCPQLVERKTLSSHMAELTPAHFAGLHNENKNLRNLFHKLTTQIAWLKADVAILNTRVGRKMRIRDSVGKWCLAYVIAISGSKARVHFLNFDSKWDEDIDFASEPYRFTRSGELCKVHNPFTIGQQVTASWRLNGATGQHPLTGAITCIDDCQLQVDNRMWYHVLEVQPQSDSKSHPLLSSVSSSSLSFPNISTTIASPPHDSSTLDLPPQPTITTTLLASSTSASSSTSLSSLSIFPSPPLVSPADSPPLPPISLSPELSASTTSLTLPPSSSRANLPLSPLSLPLFSETSSTPISSSSPSSSSSSPSSSPTSSSSPPSSSSSSFFPSSVSSSSSSSSSSSPRHFPSAFLSPHSASPPSSLSILPISPSPPPRSALLPSSFAHISPLSSLSSSSSPFSSSNSMIRIGEDGKEERKHDSVQSTSSSTTLSSSSSYLTGAELLPIERERTKRRIREEMEMNHHSSLHHHRHHHSSSSSLFVERGESSSRSSSNERHRRKRRKPIEDKNQG